MQKLKDFPRSFTRYIRAYAGLLERVTDAYRKGKRYFRFGLVKKMDIL